MDGAFDNAGIEGTMAPLHAQTEEDFDHVVAINQKGVFVGMRAQIRHMLDQGHGSIVNTASIGEVVGFPNTSLYCSTKHAVIGMTDTAARTRGRQHRREHIAPGATRTHGLSATSGADVQADATSDQIPLHRLADPADIAQAVV